MKILFSILTTALTAAAGVAAAQTAPVRTPAWTTDGYRGAATTVQTPFDPTQPGAGPSAANTVVANGDIVSQMGAPAGPYGGSVQARFDALYGGAGSGGAGAGTGTATALGNLFSLSVSGSGNTVVVDNRQTNSAAVSARVH